MLKLNFNFLDLLQDEIQKRFQISKNASKKERFSKNIISGGCAGSLSLVFVQSIDYTRTQLAVDTVNAKNGGRRQFSGIRIHRMSMSRQSSQMESEVYTEDLGFLVPVFSSTEGSTSVCLTALSH